MRGYLGLGSNQGDRLASLRAARERLDGPPAGGRRLRVVAASPVYETEPQGDVTAQPDFLNACLAVETTLGPEALLDACKAVERALGRERTGARFGPRTIDLDLLLYGSETIEEPGLTVPHPRLAERRFVLEPLAELDPALELPDGRRVGDLLARS